MGRIGTTGPIPGAVARASRSRGEGQVFRPHGIASRLASNWPKAEGASRGLATRNQTVTKRLDTRGGRARANAAQLCPTTRLRQARRSVFVPGRLDRPAGRSPSFQRRSDSVGSSTPMAELTQVHRPTNPAGKPRLVFIHGLDRSFGVRRAPVTPGVYVGAIPVRAPPITEAETAVPALSDTSQRRNGNLCQRPAAGAAHLRAPRDEPLLRQGRRQVVRRLGAHPQGRERSRSSCRGRANSGAGQGRRRGRAHADRFRRHPAIAGIYAKSGATGGAWKVPAKSAFCRDGKCRRRLP
jgi:hypothetical protein